jgi:glyoxylase-like metal-dependent hydrolase (beta-lactamase superfamily II)
MPSPHQLEPVGPGVYRFADSVVNVYVVEEGGALTVIDAAMPRLYEAFVAALAGIDRSIADIAAVLVTHGHPDHIGMAERLRVESGATVWVHEQDHLLLADPRHVVKNSKSEASFLPYLLRRPSAVAVPWHLARTGGFREAPVTAMSVFRGGETLDVPGSPTVIATPGHTRGSSSFHLRGRGAIFTGDALVTFDGLTGKRGPRVVSKAFTNDSAQAISSLNALRGLGAGLVLPGHGDPDRGGIETAVRQAVSAGTE